MAESIKTLAERANDIIESSEAINGVKTTRQGLVNLLTTDVRYFKDGKVEGGFIREYLKRIIDVFGVKPTKKTKEKEPEPYRELTVRDILTLVMADRTAFPKGLDTPITSGDFECNYTHRKHMLERGEKHSLCLAYEMHEGKYEW